MMIEQQNIEELNNSHQTKEDDPESPKELASDGDIVVVDVSRSWRPMLIGAALVLILMVLGLICGLVYGLRGNKNSSESMIEQAQEEQAMRQKEQQLLLQQCTNESISLLQDSEILGYAMTTMLDSTPLVCPDFLSPWAPCRMGEPTTTTGQSFDAKELFESVCEANSGVSYQLDQNVTLMCEWMTGGGIIGVELDSFTLCAVPTCGNEESYFMDFGVNYAIQMLREYRDLDCSATVGKKMELISKCQAKYEPTGTITDITSNACAFYTTLDSTSCADYCQQQGGDCLFAGEDVLGLNYEARKSDASCQLSGAYDQVCACTL